MKRYFKNMFNDDTLLSIVTTSCSTLPKVTLIEDVETYTMDNGIITARISKVTGDLVSLRYHDMEMLATDLKPDLFPKLKAMSQLTILIGRNL